MQQIDTATDNHNQRKHRVVEPSSNRDIHNTLPRLREHGGRRGRKTVKSQQMGEFAVRVCLLVHHKLYPDRLTNMTAKSWLNKEDTNEHAKLRWGEAHKPSPLHKEPQATDESWERQRWSSREEHTDFLSSAKWSVLGLRFWVKGKVAWAKRSLPLFSDQEPMLAKCPRKTLDRASS